MPEPDPKTHALKPMPDPWYKDGVQFKCEGTSCGDCCSGAWGSGYVWVSREEMERLAAHLGMTFDRFTRTFVRQVGERYSLVEKKNFDCIFYEKDKGCTVYNARPAQCRSYPFWPEVMVSKERWDREAKDCPGINCGGACDKVSREEIDAAKRATRKKA
jgi:Fe-S-cluster containining protein